MIPDTPRDAGRDHLGLRFGAAAKLDLIEFRDTVDELGDFGAETIGDFILRRRSVLDHVVEQGALHGQILIAPWLGAQRGHHLHTDQARMNDIGQVAVFDCVPLVRLRGKPAGSCVGVW